MSDLKINNRSTAIITKLEWISSRTGILVSWLTMVMVLVTFTVVLLRYGFNIGSIALQESIGYFHALIFMIGAAYTLQQNEHVRIDIFYQKMSIRQRAWVDLIGTLVLLTPMCVFIFIESLGYVLASWSIQEGSREAGGLEYVYLLKTVILVMPVLLQLQAIAILLSTIQILRGQHAT